MNSVLYNAINESNGFTQAELAYIQGVPNAQNPSQLVAVGSDASAQGVITGYQTA